MIRVYFRGAFFKKYIDLDCTAEDLADKWKEFIGTCRCVVDSAWLLDDTKWRNRIEQIDFTWDSRWEA